MIGPWIPVILACGLLSAYSAKSGDTAAMIQLSWRDKVDHFGVYGLLAVLVLRALPASLQGSGRWLTAFVLVSGFGFCDEWIQYQNPARTGDPLDWLADSLGALSAVVLYTTIPWIRAIANWSPVSTKRA